MFKAKEDFCLDKDIFKPKPGRQEGPAGQELGSTMLGA